MTGGLALHRIDAADNVAVALRVLEANQEATGREVRVCTRGSVPVGHKVALADIPAGAHVIKYGQSIGRATRQIEPGEHVHSHNLATLLEGLENYVYRPSPAELRRSDGESVHFDGFRREDGRVGTRNEIWILCTVGCVTRAAQRIAELGSRLFRGRVDGIHAFTHPFGCSQLGDDLQSTRKLLAALASHPNAGGVLIIGLGCESNQLDALLASTPRADRRRIRAFAAQAEQDELETGMKLLRELVQTAEHDRREPCPLSSLVVGLKCGGSDGLSGLTANPLVGRLADRVTAAGAAAVVTEIPEIFGAERALIRRAASQQVFEDLVDMINDFKNYFLDHHQPIYENPSPGNLAGGITTLEEKSLGAVQKAGTSPVMQVLRYGERVSAPGLAVLEAPGNDGVSSTALTAAGATVLLFTTGRGTPLGFPVPTLKIATNSELAAKKPHWIDFDAGRILSGLSFETATDEILKLVVATASGASAANERNGEREIVIWKRGVTL